MRFKDVFKRLPMPVKIVIAKAVIGAISWVLAKHEKIARDDLSEVASAAEHSLILTRETTRAVNNRIKESTPQQRAYIAAEAFGWDLSPSAGIKTFACEPVANVTFDKRPVEHQALLCCITFNTKSEMMLFKLAHG